jgi:CDP-glucose 4,6-dehydratase
VICVTTDKVYAGNPSTFGYMETDALGGADPYSASKSAAEMIAACYIATMAPRGNGCRIATARGGNIIGGGDWSKDRVVPDFVRAVVTKGPLMLRRPDAVRPWQHVLALVHGYLSLAAMLLERNATLLGAFNFGPTRSEAVSVGELVERLGKTWCRPDLQITPGQFPESAVLQVNSDKACSELGWQPPLDLQRTIEITAEWYRDYYANPDQARDLIESQIADYRRLLQSKPLGSPAS